MQAILRRDAAARILIVPAASPPLRTDKRFFSYRLRFRLLRRIFAPEISSGRVILSVLERRGILRYTADTLLQLEKICPQKPVIVIGADQAERLQHWQRISELTEKFRFLVFARAGAAKPQLANLSADYVEDFAEDISATELRGTLALLGGAERFERALALAIQPTK